MTQTTRPFLVARDRVILRAMANGHTVRRIWSGGDSGYLSHKLEGVKRLRESECKSLMARGYIQTSQARGSGTFKPLEITDAGRAVIA